VTSGQAGSASVWLIRLARAWGSARTLDQVPSAPTIRILDTAGESGLTLRVVTDHLSTGRGAIYHHVTNKDELLAAAADGVIGKVLAEAAGDDPRGAIRALALGIFEAARARRPCAVPRRGGHLSRRCLEPAIEY